MNPAAASRDLHVVEPRSSHLLLIGAQPTENAVCVRIDEPGHQDAAAAVDFARAAEALAEDFEGVDVRDAFARDRNCDSGAYAGVLHFAAAPRTRGPGTGHDLRAVG